MRGVVARVPVTTSAIYYLGKPFVYPTENMIGRFLRSHGIVQKDKAGYSLVGYEDLDAQQVEHLIEMCGSKLEEYKERRGRRIWQHRRASAGYVPGTARYEVLKRARFRCELCGVSADLRALEVDHIVPPTGAAPTTRTTCMPPASAATRRSATGTRPTSGG